MDGEKQAHGQNGHHQHPVVQGILRAPGGPEDAAQAQANHRRRQGVDFHNLPQANPKQLQNELRLLVKGIGQEAVVAVDEQGLGKAGAPVQGVHNEHEVRKKGQHQGVHLSPKLGKEEQRRHSPAGQKGAHGRNFHRRTPENLLVPLDKQLVEIPHSPLVTGDRGVGGDCLPADHLGGGFRLVHLVEHLKQQLLIYLPVPVKAAHLLDSQKPQGKKHPQNRQRSPERQGKPQRRQAVGQSQKHHRENPLVLFQLVLVKGLSPFFVVPKGVGRHRQLHPGDTEGKHQADPEGHLPGKAENHRKGQKSHHRFSQGVGVVRQGVAPGIHA